MTIYPKESQLTNSQVTMSTQNEQRLTTTLVEDSPIEKMVKKAISTVQNAKGYERNNEWFNQYQAQAPKDQEPKLYEKTALFKQLAVPVVKQKISTTSTTADSVLPLSGTYGHFNANVTNGPDAGTLTTKLLRREVQPAFSTVTPGKSNTGKTNGIAKKRQYNRKPKNEPVVKVKAIKPVKTTQEIIQEFNQLQLSQQNGMGNYELGFMDETAMPSISAYESNYAGFMNAQNVGELPASAASATSEFVRSPDKSSSHSSLYPEYSEELPSSQPHHVQANAVTFELPLRSHSSMYQNNQEPVFTLTLPKHLQQQQPSTSASGFEQTHASLPSLSLPPHTSSGNNGFPQETLDKPRRNLVELNKKLLREVAILRLFVRSQKVRIDTLSKQNEAYRKTLHQSTFQQELEKIDRMFLVGAENDTSKVASTDLLHEFLFG